MNYREVSRSVLLLTFVAALPFFLDYYFDFLTGRLEGMVIQQRWDIAAISIAAFLLFLLPLKYRRKADWKSYGIYTAFIVSLFIEMYGVPLSIYLSSAALNPGTATMNVLLSFNFLGQNFDLNAWMLLGLAVTAAGMALVAWGWSTIYRTEEELVTTGVYSYSRHPQYLGIILITAGWFIGWPTLLTTLMFPLLVYVYLDAARKEEKEVAAEIGEQKYQRYREQTPFLL